MPVETKKNNAAKAGIGYVIGNILIKGLSFLTLPLFARLMSTADYGLYTTYVSYESILALILGLGLYVSFKAAKIEFRDRIDAYLSTTLMLPLLASLAVVAVSMPFMKQIAVWGGFDSNKWVVILMILQAWSSSVINVYNCRVSLDFSYKSYILLSVISTIGNVGLSLVLILTLNRDNPFLGRVLGTSIPYIVIGIFLVILFFYREKPTYNREYIKFGLRYSLPLIPHGLSQQILSQFGKIVIQRKVGNDAAGIYGFAYTIALIPQIIVSSLDNAWGPWFFQKYEKRQIEEIKARTCQYVALFSCAVVGLFAVSSEIVKIMGGQSYWRAIDIVCPAILGVYFTFLYTIPVQIEYYHKKTKYIAIGTMVAALFDILACSILIPQYGYKCAVYITVVTYVLYFVAHVVIASYITNKKLPFSLKQIMIYAISVCIMCVVIQSNLDRWGIRYICVIIYIGINILIHKDVIFSLLKKRK